MTIARLLEEQKRSGRRIEFIAIERLQSPKEIRSFFEWYKGYVARLLMKEGKRVDAVKIANDNIGYILGYFKESTRRSWYGALKEGNHPFFGPQYGRGKLFSPVEAFNIGVKTGRAVRKGHEHRN